MSKIKLTIGMPMYQDYHGAWFSLQSLRLNEDLSNVELLLVDNDPTYAGSHMIKGALEHVFGNGCAGTQYIPYDEVVGPANAKNKVFEHARGEYVLCIDSHVLFRPGTIKKLLDYYERNPNTKNLIQGPLLYDDLYNTSTHFDDIWRGEMWGTWGSAWISKDGIEFSAIDDGGNLKCAELRMGAKELLNEDGAPKFPQIPFIGHEATLLKLGCRKLGLDTDEFEIPGNGCGLMSCRKDAWLGFNPKFSGFGGEEMYIHEKFRQAGRITLSLGFLKWLHRFGRPEGVKFPLTKFNKVRNYVLGHEELGLPIENVYNHFVLSGLIGQEEWKLAAGISEKASNNYITMEYLYNRLHSTPRDIDQHMPLLLEFARNCDSITEFSHRVETLIAFASAENNPQILSYNLEGNRIEAQALMELKPDTVKIHIKPSHEINEIPDTDMLFIDSEHTYSYLTNELNKFAPNTKKYIILHDTVTFGAKGTDEQIGLAYAVHDFIRNNPKWFIAAHTDEQHGLTVLSCQEQDRPEGRLTLIPPSYGPGTEMKNILSSLGVNPAPACDCNRRAMQMNIWGVEGCKKEKDAIIAWIKEGQERWGWKSRIDYAAEKGEEFEAPKSMSEKLSIIWKTVTSGLIFKLNPLNPIESLVDESIRRAEAKEKAGEYEGLI